MIYVGFGHLGALVGATHIINDQYSRKRRCFSERLRIF